MKRFQFRLETLARVREQHEDQCRQDLAAAIQATHTAMEFLQKLKTERQLLQDAFRKSLEENTCSAAATIDYQNYERVLVLRMAEAEKTIEEKKAAEAQARNKLVEAKRDTKILSNLKTRHKKRHQEQVEHEEQATLDETATTKQARKEREKEPDEREDE